MNDSEPKVIAPATIKTRPPSNPLPESCDRTNHGNKIPAQSAASNYINGHVLAVALATPLYMVTFVLLFLSLAVQIL